MKALIPLSGRRRIALIGLAIVLLGAAVPVALSVIPSRADAAASANANAGANPLSNLAGRSPGERLVGVAMKAARVVRQALGVPTEPEKPAERALARPPEETVATPEEVALVPEQVAVPLLAEEVPEFAGVPDEIVPGPGFALGSPSPIGLGPVSGGSDGSSGGGSSGGGSSGGTGTTPENPPPPPTSAVPEPATWAMMILGFGLLGGMMRRQSRKVVLSRAL